MKILALNAGSSSLKACVYALDDDHVPTDSSPLWQGRADWGHLNQAEIRVKVADGSLLERRINIGSPREAFEPLLESLWSGSSAVILNRSEIRAVGHRVVHGGEAFSESVRITPDVRAAIARSVELAPSHNRLELAGIETVDRILGSDAVQVAVFDTAFHANLPPAAFVYPGPYAWLEQGIRRYGFHGISHQYTAERAASILGRDLKSLRLISCHLGNGCSLAAIREGRCVDTTMGFTPLEGLMMGTRSGSVDPGILLYLMRHGGYSVDQLDDDMLNHESGLLGVSGISADMRRIVSAMHEDNSRAQLAFDVYLHRVRSQIGALLSSLGGLDALIFTAGVGENCASVRAAVCQGWELLRLKSTRTRTPRCGTVGTFRLPNPRYEFWSSGRRKNGLLRANVSNSWMLLSSGRWVRIRERPLRTTSSLLRFRSISTSSTPTARGSNSMLTARMAANLRETMRRGDALTWTTNAFTYSVRVPTNRPESDFTPRIVACHVAAFVPMEARQILWQR